MPDIAEVSHTRGPWYWELNKAGRQVYLMTTHSGRLVVMDFARWGTQHAAPRFRVDGIMEKAVDLSAPFRGQEHNEHWTRTITHPDAVLMAAAPELFDALVLMEKAYRALLPGAANLAIDIGLLNDAGRACTRALAYATRGAR